MKLQQAEFDAWENLFNQDAEDYSQYDEDSQDDSGDDGDSDENGSNDDSGSDDSGSGDDNGSSTSTDEGSNDWPTEVGPSNTPSGNGGAISAVINIDVVDTSITGLIGNLLGFSYGL